MIPIFSLVTSVKDYFEVVHKLVEYDSVHINYSELGSISTYFLISLKNSLVYFFSLSWLGIFQNFWSLPIIIPDISAAMVSEISILDGYFHNAFQFLDTPVNSSSVMSYGEQNSLISCLEKFSIGLINSVFLFLPTSTAHIITLRRFVMQGLEAGYVSGLGTIAGNMFWLCSIIFGWRFFVIPWLSLDVFRYVLGFLLLVKYMWDTYNEKKGDLSQDGSDELLRQSKKRQFFLLNFLLALTEQTSIYPFISDFSISPEASLLETFPIPGNPSLLVADSLGVMPLTQQGSFAGLLLFISLHSSYLLGIALGSLSLLHFSCWFWENPAFKVYMWVISSLKVSTSFYYRFLNLTFLYLTMLSAITSIPYYGLDYTITNPLGYISDDRIIQDKVILETSFLGTKASDRNTRRNRGRHGRRERWKRRIRKYRTFDASLYDQGLYDLFTIEDLNYGFDRFWLRRKLRNHRVRFRFFPGPWMRSFKKQLAKPRLESYTGPRIEFFRILFEQVYHPSFHASSKILSKKQEPKSASFVGKAFLPSEGEGGSAAFSSSSLPVGAAQQTFSQQANLPESNLNIVLNSLLLNSRKHSIYASSVPMQPLQRLATYPSIREGVNYEIQDHLMQNNLQKSTLRKFVRKVDSRLKTSLILSNQLNFANKKERGGLKEESLPLQTIISKQWKTILSKVAPRSSITPPLDSLRVDSQDILASSKKQVSMVTKNLSKKDLQILRYRSLLLNKVSSVPTRFSLDEKDGNRESLRFPSEGRAAVLLHPLKFYLQQDAGLKRKLRYYTPSVYRKFSIENNAPYFRIMMKRYFYHYKPTSRWERTMKVASLRKARRKTARIPRKLQFRGEEASGFAPLMTSEVLDNPLLPSFSPLSLRAAFALPGKAQREKDASIGVSERAIKNDEKKVIPNMPVKSSAFQRSVQLSNVAKKTYNYSVVSKRASRYRYEIYKDVLQHWYYSPFNRFLLKLDVDSFIRRQPNAHFLTEKEENLLHLRRFLLSEHYNTLRWYTNMEHYRSMKTQLNGSTKSFSSGVYNQQFAGTFKKIRHLFAITPSQGSLASTVLKFDQPLYNEYANTTQNPLLNPLIIHEELLLPASASLWQRFPEGIGKQNSLLVEREETIPFRSSLKGDILSESQNIVRDYLLNSESDRHNYIQKLLNEKNYLELTKFIYKGKKLRGDKPVTNQQLLNAQEKNYLLANPAFSLRAAFALPGKAQRERRAGDDKHKDPLNPRYLKGSPVQSDLYLTYLKKWKARVNDQESLKNYLTRRVEKRDKRKVKKEKQFIEKLKRLEKWSSQGSGQPEGEGSSDIRIASSKKDFLRGNVNLTSGLRKSILEGLFVLNGGVRTPYIVQKGQKELFLSKLQKKLDNDFSGRLLDIRSSNSSSDHPERSSSAALRFNNLKLAHQNKMFKDIKTSVTQLNNVIDQTSAPTLFEQELTKQGKSSRVGFRYKLMTIMRSAKIYLWKSLHLLSPSAEDLSVREYSRKIIGSDKKKERVLTRQKRSRKEFKLLSKKSDSKEFSSYLDVNDLALSLNKAAPSRKKSEKKGEDNFFFNNNLLPALQSTLNFKRKKSPQRRARTRRGRGVFRKRTLTDSLKNDLKSFYNQKHLASLDSFKKQKFYEKINHKLYSVSSKFSGIEPSINGNLSLSPPFQALGEQKELKQRKSKQRKQRSWKEKRAKFSQKRKKYRKRRRYTISKIRSLSKQFKRVQNKNEIQNWWWKQFIPSIQASTEALWQIENNKLIQQKLSELSVDEILERDALTTASLPRSITLQDGGKLQIGNKDFKPLALPESIKQIYSVKNLPTNSSDLPSNNGGLQSLERSVIGMASESQVASRFFGAEGSTLLKGNNENTDHSVSKNASLNIAYPKKNGIQTNDWQEGNFNMLNKLYSNLFTNKVGLKTGFRELMLPNAGLPFYAGWDESLRKFVVTNRMLSRQDAGYAMQLRSVSSILEGNSVSASRTSKSVPKEYGQKSQRSSSKFLGASNAEAVLIGQNSIPALNSLIEGNTIQKIEFTQAPLRGMNAATTLYWQIPFTTYDPDQFFALGMDGFSPIGWRQFLFRHSILKTWLNTLNSSSTDNTKVASLRKAESFSAEQPSDKSLTERFIPSSLSGGGSDLNNKGLIIKSRGNILTFLNQSSFDSRQESKLSAKNSPPSLFESKKAFAFSRRLKKRYGRVKKHPRTPVWFPSGPLLNQVLPVHYIYVFYKRARLPRDRYLKRRLLNIKTVSDQSSNVSLLKNTDPSYYSYDFTIRKRLKPKRKYHLKRSSSNIVIPRRLKFMGLPNSLNGVTNWGSDSIQKWRPLSALKVNKPIAELIKEQKILRSKQRRKELGTKQPNLRVKQLRRRIQRQVLRSVWRYRPRAGGFVWPGDYLQLELVKGPNLERKLQVKINASDSLQPSQSDVADGLSFNKVINTIESKQVDNASEQGESGRKKGAARRGKTAKKGLNLSTLEWQVQPKKYLYEKHNMAAKPALPLGISREKRP